MSVFKTQTKTIKTNITGEELELRINNAIDIFMRDMFGLNSTKFEELLKESPTEALGKLLLATLKANKIDVTFEEVMENTIYSDLDLFYVEYLMVQYSLEMPDENAEGEESENDESAGK